MMNGHYKFLLFHVLVFLGRNELGSAIIGGEIAPDESMLYMASVQNRDEKHLCGGFLVCKDLVVTAAHCDVENNERVVVLGTHDLRKIEKTIKTIKEIIKCPYYNRDTNENNIMFLKLYGDDNWLKKGQPIQLPTSETNIVEKCRVAGWGLTENGTATVDKLMVVDVPIIKCSVVKKEWSGLPANVICAEKRLRKGDFGGPLVCNGIPVGVASFFKKGDCKSSDVYSDISKILPWIQSVLKKNGC